MNRFEHANSLVSIYDLIEHVSDHTRPRKIHCPVHEDRSKSAQVYPSTNSIYCWACGRAYDPVSIIAEQEGLEPIGAVVFIEKNAGVRWEKQETEESEFWNMVKKAKADADDPEYWSAREKMLYRWEVHRTVAELVEEPDWDGFDNAHMDVKALRAWRSCQLSLSRVKVDDESSKETV